MLNALRRWPKDIKIGVLVGVAAFLLVLALVYEPFAQPAGYHDFADKRGCLGIPNFGNVATNLPFLLAGLLGIGWLIRGEGRPAGGVFPYWVFFGGVALVCAGSGYYHWAPDNDRLFWDRLPMTLAFSALLAGFIADRVTPKASPMLIVALTLALVALGAAGALYWHMSEGLGRGDLRFYFLAQAIPMALIPLTALLFEGRLTNGRHLVWILLLYGAAILCEQLDLRIFQGSAGAVSGHSIKHLFAAGAAWMVLPMLKSGADEG